jgi:peptidoglycan/xylan/chitin deacetylase (PgdA/CDA1 family)
VFLFHPRWFVTWVGERLPHVLFCVDTNEPVIALTIDDGPHATVTPAILDVLARHGAHATFFVLGECIPGNEALLDRIRNEGHELANHLFTDMPSILLSDTEIESQLVAVDSMITTGPIKWFRPGSGWFRRGMLQVVRKHGYRCVLGSVYPIDTHVRSNSLIEKNALGGLAPGAILVLHDGQADRMRTVEVLESILPRIKALGLRVVTLTDLVGVQRPPSVIAAEEAPR